MNETIFYIIIFISTILIILWVNGIEYMKQNIPTNKENNMIDDDDTKHLLSSTKNKQRLINSINQIKQPSDEQLLGIYLLGFEDQINNKPIITLDNKLSQKAYNLGRMNALINDNNESPIKNISTKQIINKIRK
jgi:hypothetical protein